MKDANACNLIVIIIIDVIVELKISEIIYCVRCQVDMSIRIKIYVQIFYQQYELFVTFSNIYKIEHNCCECAFDFDFFFDLKFVFFLN